MVGPSDVVSNRHDQVQAIYHETLLSDQMVEAYIK